MNVKYKIALSPTNLRRLLDACDETPNRLRGMCDRAMFALAWAGNFRCSEIVRLDTSHILSIDKKQITLQFDSRRIVVPDSAPSYPVTALLLWLKEAGEAGFVSGRLFRSVRKGGLRIGDSLSEVSVRRQLGVMLGKIGISGEHCSFLSLRKGRITDAYGKMAFKDLVRISRISPDATLKNVVGNGVAAPGPLPTQLPPRPAAVAKPGGLSMDTISAIWAAEDAGKGAA